MFCLATKHPPGHSNDNNEKHTEWNILFLEGMDEQWNILFLEGVVCSMSLKNGRTLVDRRRELANILFLDFVFNISLKHRRTLVEERTCDIRLAELNRPTLVKKD